MKKMRALKLRITLRHALVGAAFGLLFPLISSLIWIFERQYPLTLLSLGQAQVNNPLQWIINTAPLFLGIAAGITGARQAQIVELNYELEDRLDENEKILADMQCLKKKLESASDDQILRLKTAAQIARQAADIRELQVLLQSTVDLISERFGFYHAGLFLLDSKQEYAILQTASSDGGKVMVARHHRLKVGEVGIVGYAARSGMPRIALDVGDDPVFFNNPHLPATRSEMALPLKVRGEVIGVLDVQSTEPTAFDNDDLEILQILADQIALAIDNTRLLQETRQAVADLERNITQQVQSAWQAIAVERQLAFEYNRQRLVTIHPTVDLEPAEPEATPGKLQAAIQLRGQTLGKLVLKKADPQAQWSAEERQAVSAILEQTARALENARLLEESRQRVRQESLVSEVSAQIRATLDIDTVLQTAVRQIGSVLRLAEAEILLGEQTGSTPGERPANGHNKQPPFTAQPAGSEPASAPPRTDL